MEKKYPYLISIDRMGTKIKDDAYSAYPEKDGWWTVNACIADVPAHIKTGSKKNQLAIKRKFENFLFDFNVANSMSLSNTLSQKMIWFKLKLNPNLEVREIQIKRIQGKVSEIFSYEEADKALGAASLEEDNPLNLLWKLSCLLKENRPKKAVRQKYCFKSEQIVTELAILLNGSLAKKAMKEGQKLLFRNTQNNRPYFSITAKGHHGLKLPAYAWFTSPIWRYVDLVNLRAILGYPLPNKLYNLAKAFNKKEKK